MSAQRVHAGSGSGHSHAHGHGAPGTGSPTKVIAWALAANSTLAVGQVVAGIVFGSIALMADSVHQIVDVGGLGIALVAIRLSGRGVTGRNTFGWGRADVLGALTSALLLVGSSIWITFEAIRRLADPQGIDGVGILIVAIVGFVVNAGSAVALSRAGDSLSTRAAVVHLIGDAAGSLGVLVSAVAVLAANATWVDPLVAIAIAIWVGWTGIQLLGSSGRILLDVVPGHLSTIDVLATIASVDGIVGVHHVHLWEPAPGEPSISAHVIVNGDMVVHEAQALLDAVRARLISEYDIRHATFEVECHPCDDEVHGTLMSGVLTPDTVEESTSVGPPVNHQ